MEEQEISLRELIEVLLKGKYLIVGITLICLIIAFVFSFYVIEPTYQAEAKLLVSDLKATEPKTEGIDNLINNISNYPNFTVESYKEQIKNKEILSKVREELELDEKKYPLNTLAEMITIENPKNTNILTIRVKEENPELAAKIANTLALNFSDFVTQLSKEQAAKSQEYITEQLKIEEENLNKVMLEYKRFLEQPAGVFELESEQTSKITLLTGLKEQLTHLEINISIAENALKEAQRQLSTTEQTIITRKSISDDPALYSYFKESTGMSAKDALPIEMTNEEINPIYLDLNKTISDAQLKLSEFKVTKNEILQQISLTQKYLEQLQVELADKKHQNDVLSRQVDLAQSTYNSFMNKYEETRIAQSSRIGERAVVISSQAMVPVNPVSPKKMLNLAIAGVLGLMLGVFIAFFREYWISTSKITKQPIEISSN